MSIFKNLLLFSASALLLSMAYVIFEVGHEISKPMTYDIGSD